MSCSSPGATHHLACDCREAELEKLLHYYQNRAVDGEARLAAAEARIRGLEEALRNAVEMIHDASGPLEYARANDWMRGQLRALATPQQPATAEELA